MSEPAQKKKSNVAVIGTGSWATALLKLIQLNDHVVHWYVPDEQRRQDIKNHGRNNKYLSILELDTQVIEFHSDIKECIDSCEYILLSIPSHFLASQLQGLNSENLKGKKIISAIKGIIPRENELISLYLINHFQVSLENLIVLSGPSYAEEVASGRETYITLAGNNQELAKEVSGLIQRAYIHISFSKDLKGIELSAVLKNVYAIACGICNSLGYGDNFQAVLVSESVREMKKILETVFPDKSRHVLSNVYLGDLLVTAYSQFSRNRSFGNMLGKGYSAKLALMEMTMVPEGYYIVEPLHELLQKRAVEAPIVNAVYHILHEGISPHVEIKILSSKISN